MTHQTTAMQGNCDFRCYFFLLWKMYMGLLMEERKLIVDAILMDVF